jgi:hypothetical protein
MPEDAKLQEVGLKPFVDGKGGDALDGGKRQIGRTLEPERAADLL